MLDNGTFCGTIYTNREPVRDWQNLKKVCAMKKMLVSAIALSALAGCGGYYDYYKGGVRYTQSGQDCIYYAGERGRNLSSYVDGLDNSKKIVYRNTSCEDLYARDMFGQKPRNDRQILISAPQDVPCGGETKVEKVSCGYKTCGQAVLKRRYVIM